MSGDPSKKRRGLWGRAVGCCSVAAAAASSILRRAGRPGHVASRQAQLLLVGVVVVGLVTILGAVTLWTAFLGWPESLSTWGTRSTSSGNGALVQHLGVVRDIVAPPHAAVPQQETPPRVRGGNAALALGSASSTRGQKGGRGKPSTHSADFGLAAPLNGRRALLPLDSSPPPPRIAFAVPVGGRKDRSGPLLRLLEQLECVLFPFLVHFFSPFPCFRLRLAHTRCCL